MSVAMESLTARHKREVGTFVVVGVTCAAVNFGVGVVVRVAGGPLLPASVGVVAGFIAGAILSFVLNRRYTFRVHEDAVGPQAFRFALASLASVALSACVAEVLVAVIRAVPGLDLPRPMVQNLAHVGTIGVVFVFNYFAMKFFALKA